MPELESFRCVKCDKKLAAFKGIVKLEIICPRCGALNQKDTTK
jgi:phage FluMu protein Com